MPGAGSAVNAVAPPEWHRKTMSPGFALRSISTMRSRAGHAVLIGDRMAGQRDGDALQPDAVALLGVDLPAGDAVAEDLLQRLSLALGHLAAADHVDIADRRQVERQLRLTGRLGEIGVADEQPPILDAHDLLDILVRIGRGETSFEHIKHDLPCRRVTLAQQCIAILDDHKATPLREKGPVTQGQLALFQTCDRIA